MKFLIILITCVCSISCFIDYNDDYPSDERRNFPQITTQNNVNEAPNDFVSKPSPEFTNYLGYSWINNTEFKKNHNNLPVKTGRDFEGVDYYIIRDIDDGLAIGKFSLATGEAVVVKNWRKVKVDEFEVRKK